MSKLETRDLVMVKTSNLKAATDACEYHIISLRLNFVAIHSR